MSWPKGSSLIVGGFKRWPETDAKWDTMAKQRSKLARKAASRRSEADVDAIADLRFETFGSSGRLATQSFQVRIPRHDLAITVPADCTLLEALDAAGVQTLSDCKRGECGLCAMDVISVDGEIDHRDVFLSEHEKKSTTRICACVSRAVGTLTLDSAYRADS